MKLKNLLIEKSYTPLVRLYNSIKSDIINYNFKRGEKVLVKHKSWEEPRTMIVSKPGKQPILKRGGIEVDLKFISGYDFVLPEDTLEKSKKNVKSKKIKRMSKSNYFKLLKDMIHGLEHEDSGIFYDQAENIYNTNKAAVEYVVRVYNVRTKSQAIEQIANDLQTFAK